MTILEATKAALERAKARGASQGVIDLLHAQIARLERPTLSAKNPTWGGRSSDR